MTQQVWIIGAGPMAKAYLEVLSAMNVPHAYVSRTPKLDAPWLALEHAATRQLPPFVIIATPIETLVDVALRFPAKHLLLEKPGGLALAPLNTLKSNISFAHNRRFLASVMAAKRRIAQSNLLSFHFEFNENAPLIENLLTPALVKENWLLANSSHVIDLAFYLGGMPRKLNAFRAGATSWHSRGAYFSGHGETKAGAQFTYASEWRSGGQWGLELMLPQERLILRPLETLVSIKTGTFRRENIRLDDALDKAFKPGLYKQVEAFLQQKTGVLPRLSQQKQLFKHISKIGGY